VDRFLKNTANAIEFDIGVVATGTPTVTIVDGAGEEHLAAAATTNPSEGIYRLALTPAQTGSVLDTYTATLSALINGAVNLFETQYEVVGGSLFSVDEGRAFRGNKFTDPTKYPMQTIVDHREEIEDFIEEVIGYPVVQHGRRVLIDGASDYELFLPDLRVGAPYSVTVTDSAGTLTVFDAPSLADLVVTEYGSIRRKTLGTWTSGYRNVAIHYPYGLTSVPGPLKRAALIMLYNRLLPTDISDRAQSFTNESGTLNYSSPNGQRPTGIPEVDAILARYADHRVSIA
jgi:hypothetical protein